MKLKAFFHYYRRLLVYNIEFTCTMLFLLAGSSILSSPEVTLADADRIALLGLIMFLVTGTAFSFIVFRIFKASEYPFYYNLGFLPVNLKIYASGVNLLIALVSIAIYLIVTRWLI